MYLPSSLNIHVTYLEHLFSSRALKHFMHYILRLLLMPRYFQHVSWHGLFLSSNGRNTHLCNAVRDLQCHAEWKVLLTVFFILLILFILQGLRNPGICWVCSCVETRCSKLNAYSILQAMSLQMTSAMKMPSSHLSLHFCSFKTNFFSRNLQPLILVIVGTILVRTIGDQCMVGLGDPVGLFQPW